MRSLFLVTVTLLSLNCHSQKVVLEKQALTIIQNDCGFILEYLEIEDQKCSFAVSEILIPLEIALFHESITSFDRFSDLKQEGAFDHLTILDLQYEQTKLRNPYLKELSDDKSVAPLNIGVFFTEVYNGLIACEVIEYRNGLSTDQLDFGKSVQYLFEVDSDKQRILNHLKIDVHIN